MTNFRLHETTFLLPNGAAHDGAIMERKAREDAASTLLEREKITSTEWVGGSSHGTANVNGREVHLEAERKTVYYYQSKIEREPDEDEDADAVQEQA